MYSLSFGGISMINFDFMSGWKWSVLADRKSISLDTLSGAMRRARRVTDTPLARRPKKAPVARARRDTLPRKASEPRRGLGCSAGPVRLQRAFCARAGG